ncbi:hypothetical protein Q8F55_007351 [Vanrija albida]|uniref:OPT family small oligopeptide transporter n=1 Tax=Vanrija albida TaxID=181172 RepID=A0ABR3PTB0_9TREE
MELSRTAEDRVPPLSIAQPMEEPKIKEGLHPTDKDSYENVAILNDPKVVDDETHEAIIVTGEDAANFLLSVRDDGDPALTFRSMFLGTGVAAFQATMNQIYSRWVEQGGTGKKPLWLSLALLLNPREFGLKEHAIAALCATSASNATASINVFTVQKLFYDSHPDALTVILTILSTGLFGYGLTGLLRPVTVWDVEAVYWTNIPVVKTLQALHWDGIKTSKPLRVFWYCFGGMAVWQIFPAYLMPWLNSISIPCLAAMNAKGETGKVLNNIFGGSLNNQGLGLFSVSLDWQYITSYSTSLPLKMQINFLIGLIICYCAYIGVYYTNRWDAKSFPFMSNTLRRADGGRYVPTNVFIDGKLDEAKLADYGLPYLSGSFAYSLMIVNSALGALIAHALFFWSGGVIKSIKNARKGFFPDRHHNAMKKYNEVEWYWYVSLIVISFVFGIVVVAKRDVGLPIWGYVLALACGSLIAPLNTILYSRFGDDISTRIVMKMIAGLAIPGRPIGNLYFGAWSYAIVEQTESLSSELKMGEYLKIPPRVMFATQIWGTVFGAFINYVVMVSIVNRYGDLLSNSNGSSTWSGANYQAINANATTWALAKYLYAAGGRYIQVPAAIGFGFLAVCVHRFVYIWVKKIGPIHVNDINFPQLLSYSGSLAGVSQGCILLSRLIVGFYTQFYLRNYKPKIFSKYSYLVTAAFDGGSLVVLFILSFAVFGAGNSAPVYFPEWWGNLAWPKYLDHCPQITT